MKYLELGEIFKIDIDNKMIYLKTEIDASIILCENCYFHINPQYCDKFVCSQIDREDDINVIFKQIKVIEKLFVVIGENNITDDKTKWTVCAYPTKEDAKKRVEELTKTYFTNAYHIEEINYCPYGLIENIQEIKLFNN